MFSFRNLLSQFGMIRLVSHLSFSVLFESEKLFVFYIILFDNYLFFISGNSCQHSEKQTFVYRDPGWRRDKLSFAQLSKGLYST